MLNYQIFTDATADMTTDMLLAVIYWGSNR